MKVINLDSDGPDCMPQVYFYQLPVGEVFLWKNDNYRKTAIEEAIEIDTNKKWVFEIHYRVALSEARFDELGLGDSQ